MCLAGPDRRRRLPRSRWAGRRGPSAFSFLPAASGLQVAGRPCGFPSVCSCSACPLLPQGLICRLYDSSFWDQSVFRVFSFDYSSFSLIFSSSARLIQLDPLLSMAVWFLTAVQQHVHQHHDIPNIFKDFPFYFVIHFHCISRVWPN